MTFWNTETVHEHVGLVPLDHATVLAPGLVVCASRARCCAVSHSQQAMPSCLLEMLAPMELSTV